jgi:hypothetical protein
MVAKGAIREAAERLVGEPVRDAVLLVGRPPRTWALFAAGFGVGLVIAKVIGVDGPWDVGIAGGVGGIGMQAGMAYRFLVRTEHGLALASSKRWIGRPKTLIGTVDPRTVSIEQGAINRKVLIAGEPYVMSRMFAARLRAMLEGLGDSAPNVPPGYTPYQP